jgi:hypothetical protein
MSKTHKLLVLIGDSEFIQESLSSRVTQEVCDQIFYNKEPYMRVIEVCHEDPKDNMVELDDDMEGTITFIRDIHGKLYYCDDYLSKTDLINKFE